MANIDLAALLQSVESEREDDVLELGALAATWEDPPGFRQALWDWAQRTSVALRSEPNKAYDLYADAVQRHATSSNVALIELAPRSDPVRLSFTELHRKASSLAATWAALEVKAGAAITIILPPGITGAVALAAGWYLGACVSWILPAGDVALDVALKALAPDHVVIDPKRPPAIGKLAKVALPLDASLRSPPSPPYAYAPKEPCVRALSPLRAPFATASDVPAERMMAGTLSDAHLVYRLRPGDRLAAPGFHHEQCFLPLLLSAWLAGAAFVQLPFDFILASPSALDLEPIHVLGLAPALAQHLQASPRRRPRALQATFRNVAEPIDWLEYHDALLKNDLRKVPAFNVLIDTAEGGTVLFSARRPAGVSAKVLPSPGVGWALYDPATKKVTTADVGLFVRRGGKPDKDGYFMLARLTAEMLWANTLLPRRSARVFPEEALSDLVAALPFAKGAAVVPRPGEAERRDTGFVLCVFVGVQTLDPAWAKQLAALIEGRLGPDWTPNRVEIFPLYPREKAKKTDAAWCSSHYSAGRLHARTKNPGVQKLNTLRSLLLP